MEHTQGLEKKFEDSVEGNDESSTSSLQAKSWSEVNEESCEKLFKCNICSKAFSRKHHLSQHLYTHTDVKPFKCKNCSKSFSQKSNLNRHLYTHTNEKPFICTICTKSFSQKSILNRHLYILHSK